MGYLLLILAAAGMSPQGSRIVLWTRTCTGSGMASSKLHLACSDMVPVLYTFVPTLQENENRIWFLIISKLQLEVGKGESEGEKGGWGCE